jgi:hypothetical protein
MTLWDWITLVAAAVVVIGSVVLMTLVDLEELRQERGTLERP